MSQNTTLKCYLAVPERKHLSPMAFHRHLASGWVGMVALPQLSAILTTTGSGGGSHGFSFVTGSSAVDWSTGSFCLAPDHTPEQAMIRLDIHNIAGWGETLDTALGEHSEYISKPCLVCQARPAADSPADEKEGRTAATAVVAAPHPHFHFYIADKDQFFHPEYLPMPSPFANSADQDQEGDEDVEHEHAFEYEYGYRHNNCKTGWLDACYVMSALRATR